MGIRINKRLGYGFNDLTLDDNRINWGVFEDSQECKLSDFISYLKLVSDRSLEMGMYFRSLEDGPIKHDPYLSSFMSYDSEMGDPKVFCISSLLYAKQWYRRDDTIDYFSDMQPEDDGDTMQTEVKTFEYGIYPYDCTIININNNKSFRVKEYRSAKISFADKLRHLPDETAKSKLDEYRNQFRPDKPSLVKHLAKFCGVKEESIPQMKAILYKYWS